MSAQENKILVFTKCPVTALQLEIPIKIEKLCFWYSGNITHPVNSRTIPLFIRQVEVYGAFVYPLHPEKGCFAINGDHQLSKEEIQVSQIYYCGQLLYNR